MANSQFVTALVNAKSQKDATDIIDQYYPGLDSGSVNKLVNKYVPQSTGEKVAQWLPTIGAVALPTIADLATGGLAIPADMALSAIGAASGEAGAEKLKGEKLNTGQIMAQGGVGAAASVVGIGAGKLITPALEKLGVNKLLDNVIGKGAQDVTQATTQEAAKAGVNAGTEMASKSAQPEAKTIVQQMSDFAKSGDIGVRNRAINYLQGQMYKNIDKAFPDATAENAWLMQDMQLGIKNSLTKGQRGINTANQVMDVVSGVQKSLLNDAAKQGDVVVYADLTKGGKGLENVLSDALSTTTLSGSDKIALKTSIENLLKPESLGSSGEGIFSGISPVKASDDLKILDKTEQTLWDSWKKSGDQATLEKAKVYQTFTKALSNELDDIAAISAKENPVTPEVAAKLTQITGNDATAKMFTDAGNQAKPYSAIRNAESYFVNLKRVAQTSISNVIKEGGSKFDSPFMAFRVASLAGGGYAALNKNPPLAVALMGAALFGIPAATSLLKGEVSPAIAKMLAGTMSIGMKETATLGGQVGERGAQAIAESALSKGASVPVHENLTSMSETPPGQASLGVTTIDAAAQATQYQSQINQLGRALIMQDIQKTGGRNISKISSYINAISAVAPQLTSSQTTQINNYNEAVNAFNAIYSQYQNVGPRGLLGGLIGGVANYSTNQQYLDNLQVQLLPILKTLSGSSSTATALVTNFAKEIPKITDSPDTAKQKWGNIAQQLQNIGQEIQSGLPT